MSTKGNDSYSAEYTQLREQYCEMFNEMKLPDYVHILGWSTKEEYDKEIKKIRKKFYKKYGIGKNYHTIEE